MTVRGMRLLEVERDIMRMGRDGMRFILLLFGRRAGKGK